MHRFNTGNTAGANQTERSPCLQEAHILANVSKIDNIIKKQRKETAEILKAVTIKY